MSAKRGVRWGAVAWGWTVAVLVGLLVNPLLRLLYWALAGTPAESGEITANVAVIAVVSGFLAYLAGGYAAAALAGHSGGKHGALTAVVGLVAGVILAVALSAAGPALIPSGVAMPPANFGLFGAALLAGLVLFAVNLFGGFVGGKLGEPLLPRDKRAG